MWWHRPGSACMAGLCSSAFPLNTASAARAWRNATYILNSVAPLLRRSIACSAWLPGSSRRTRLRAVQFATQSRSIAQGRELETMTNKPIQPDAGFAAQWRDMHAEAPAR
jgi:hypothetical protein